MSSDARIADSTSPPTFHAAFDVKSFPSEIKMAESTACKTLGRYSILRKYIEHYQYIQHVVEKATESFLHTAFKRMGELGMDFYMSVWANAVHSLDPGELHDVFQMIPGDIWPELNPLLDNGRQAMYDMHAHIKQDLKEPVGTFGTQSMASCRCEVVHTVRILRWPVPQPTVPVGQFKGETRRARLTIEMFWEIKLSIQENTEGVATDNSFFVRSGANIWRDWDAVCQFDGENVKKKQFLESKYSVPSRSFSNVTGQTASINSIAPTGPLQQMMTFTSGDLQSTGPAASINDVLSVTSCKRCEDTGLGHFVVRSKHATASCRSLQAAFEEACQTFRTLG